MSKKGPEINNCRYLPELATQASNGEITLKGEARPDGIFSAKVEPTIEIDLVTTILIHIKGSNGRNMDNLDKCRCQDEGLP